MFYRRHLPHWVPGNRTLFVSWRLAGSMPGAGTGPLWLADERIAEMVAQTIVFGNPGRYRLHAWVIMPNHVHMIIDAVGELAAIMRWMKGRTARRANRVLGRSGEFWQDESFDHWIRSDAEYWTLVRYVENNPVAARLVETASDWRWSSAWGGAGDRFVSPAG